MRYVKFKKEKKYIEDFLRLSKEIYSKNDNMEDYNNVKCLLEETHPLSKYFKLDKFLIYDNNSLVGRFILTSYPNDDTLYIGFFECVNNIDVSKYLFSIAYKYAKKKKFKKIVGPVDASFWIKYRLKINKFDSCPYTGEPYNKDYYLNLFLDSGYKIIEKYTSNVYQAIDSDYDNDKFSSRYKEFCDSGYKIISPDLKNYDSILVELYYLLTSLYKSFPIYKDLSLEDFKSTFNSYKSIINTSMVKLAYYQDRLVGFYISVPNYTNKVYHLNLFNLLKILSIRRNPKEYVMLYMGADPSHRGLGKAMSYAIMMELKKSNLRSISALIREGNINNNYVSELINDRYEYVLLEKVVK